MAASGRGTRHMHLITYLTRVQFGSGARSALRDEVGLSGATRPMIVTDRGVVAAGLVEQVVMAFGATLPVFEDCPENPTEAAAREALRFFGEHACDAIIGIGGGSPIDLAKAVALLATHPGPLERYAAIAGGAALITDAKPAVFAVPTTAGTGSEVGRAALITLDDGRKLGFISPHMIPRAAICDPDLTLRFATAPDGGDGHGRRHPLHRDLSLSAVQPARGRDRPRWSAARDALDQACDRSWVRRRGAIRDDARRTGRRHDVSEGVGRRAWLVAPARRVEEPAAASRHAERDPAAARVEVQCAGDLARAAAPARGHAAEARTPMWPMRCLGWWARSGCRARCRLLASAESIWWGLQRRRCGITRLRPIRVRWMRMLTACCSMRVSELGGVAWGRWMLGLCSKTRHGQGSWNRLAWVLRV